MPKDNLVSLNQLINPPTMVGGMIYRPGLRSGLSFETREAIADAIEQAYPEACDALTLLLAFEQLYYGHSVDDVFDTFFDVGIYITVLSPETGIAPLTDLLSL